MSTIDTISKDQRNTRSSTGARLLSLLLDVLFGLETSVTIGRRMIRSAHRSLAPFGERVQVLHDLADYIVQRDR